MDERSTSLAGMKAVLIGDAPSASLTIVFLHGRGMRPADLTPFAHSLAIPGIAYVFPEAPLPEPSGGFSWWSERADEGRVAGGDPTTTSRDLAGFAPPGRRAARSHILELLRAVSTARPGAPVVLAGFSQGGMLACDTVLMEAVRIDGLVMLSSSRIAVEDWSRQCRRLQGLPALVSHGRQDRDLAFSAGERLHDFLKEGGAAVSWAPFDGGHEIPFPVWRQFRRFVRSIQSAGSSTNEKIASYGTH